MSFPLVGNEKISLAILNALKENRLPHAILIEGDVGLGKHTLAFYLAKAAVCSESNSPCGLCKNCKLGALHPDITVTAPEEKKKNISVAQIRALKTEAYIKPHQAKKRVFIIDCADTLNEQSQNALLKVLEEPPETTMFILIAKSKASLLETVLSRCTILTLSAPQTSEAVNYIKSKTAFSEADIKDALENSQNNIGSALNLLNGKSDSKTYIAAKEFLECFLRGNSFGMLSVTAPLEKSRVDADAFFEDLKIITAQKLRSNTQGYTAVYLSKLYALLQNLEKTLITNINLTLLFCALVSEAEKITLQN